MLLYGRYKQRLLAVTSVIVASLAWPTLAAESKLEQQRLDYDKAQKLIDNKDISGYQKLRPKIAGYSLTPYIDYRVFSLQLSDKSPDEVETFIEQHKSFPFSSRIRAPYLDQLARQNKWQDILTFQTSYPNGERYQCHYHYAQWKTGNKQDAFKGAETLWLSGNSVDSACDGLFSAWDKSGALTDELIVERMILAFEKRNGSLINYLNKKLSSSTGKQQGNQIKTLFKSPNKVVSFADSNFPQPYKNQLIELSLQKLARSDKDKARTVLATLTRNASLDDTLKQSMQDYVAMRYMTTDSDSDAKWRDSVLRQSNNDGYLERRARLAVQEADWEGLNDWVGKMSPEKQETSRWQYWLARSELATGNQEQGKKRLEGIVGQRNFYSAAAATYLEHSIVYPVSTTVLNPNIVAPYQRSLDRIEELIERDKIAAAKSEWRFLLSNVGADEKQMLAAYAGKNAGITLLW